MAERAPFTQPPFDLFTDPRLSDGDRQVYVIVSSFGDFGTLANCRPGLSAIADRARKDKSTIARSLANLEKAGWLNRERRTTHGKESDTTLYSFPLHKTGLSQERDGVVAEMRQGSSKNATGVVAEMRQGVVAKTRHYLEPVTKIQDRESDAPSNIEEEPDWNTVATKATLELEAAILDTDTPNPSSEPTARATSNQPPTPNPQPHPSPSSAAPPSRAKVKRGEPNRPESFDVVRSYCVELGLPEDQAQAFVDYFAEYDWHDAKKRPVLDWRGRLRTWKRNFADRGGVLVPCATLPGETGPTDPRPKLAHTLDALRWIGRNFGGTHAAEAAAAWGYQWPIAGDVQPYPDRVPAPAQPEPDQPQAPLFDADVSSRINDLMQRMKKNDEYRITDDERRRVLASLRD